jgi:hypothetical protein
MVDSFSGLPAFVTSLWGESAQLKISRDDLLTLLEKLSLSSQLVYDAFKKGYCSDLFFWTGFSSVGEFDEAILDPLSSYLSTLGSCDRPSSELKMEDRVLWVFVYMWTDCSINQLWKQLEKQGLVKMEWKSFRQVKFCCSFFDFPTLTLLTLLYQDVPDDCDILGESAFPQYPSSYN